MICSTSKPKDYTVLAQLTVLVMRLFHDIFHLRCRSDLIPFITVSWVGTVDDLSNYQPKHESEIIGTIIYNV